MEKNIIKTEKTKDGDLRETIEIITTQEQIQNAATERVNVQNQIDDLISRRDAAIVQATNNTIATFAPDIDALQNQLDELNALVKKGEDNKVIAVSVEKVKEEKAPVDSENQAEGVE